jgi:hypothetical protein
VPAGWSELPLTDAMKARIRGQAMVQDDDAKRSVIVAVRPDGRASPTIDMVFAAQFIDSFIVEARSSGLTYTRGEVALIDWDGLSGAEIPATLNDGDSDKAVVFRLIAANGFVYNVRAVQEKATAIDGDLRGVLEGFRLTKKPEPVLAEATVGDETPAAGDPASTPAEDGSAAATPTPASSNMPFIIIGIIAGVGIIAVLLLPLLMKKKKRRSPRRGGRQRESGAREGLTDADDGGPRPSAARRPTVQMDAAQQARAVQADAQRRPTVVSPPARRTTVRMPDQAAAPQPPQKPLTTTRRRRPPG